eukprot:EG_transcript_3468
MILFYILHLGFLTFAVCESDTVPQQHLYITGLRQNEFLGDHTMRNFASPWMSNLTVTVAAGSFHTVVLAGGDLYAMGVNANGQLGDGTTANRAAFVRMIPMWDAASPVTAVTASYSLFAPSHTAILAGGRPFTVGYNGYGQLGDSTTADRSLFVQMAHSWDSTVIATAIAAGAFHTVVLIGSEVFAVGYNNHGQLGDGTQTQRLTLVRVFPAWGSATVTAIAAGHSHTLAVAGGQVFAVGANGLGQLADGTTIPKSRFVPVLPTWASNSDVTALAAGSYHSVLLTGNELFAAGSNMDSQLGINTTEASRTTFTQMVRTWDETAAVTALVAGYGHTVVLAGGTPFAVGSNFNGQLGDGTTADRSAFVRMTAVPGSTGTATAIAANSYFTLVAADQLVLSPTSTALITLTAGEWWADVPEVSPEWLVGSLRTSTANSTTFLHAHHQLVGLVGLLAAFGWLAYWRRLDPQQWAPSTGHGCSLATEPQILIVRVSSALPSPMNADSEHDAPADVPFTLAVHRPSPKVVLV